MNIFSFFQELCYLNQILCLIWGTLYHLEVFSSKVLTIDHFKYATYKPNENGEYFKVFIANGFSIIMFSRLHIFENACGSDINVKVILICF